MKIQVNGYIRTTSPFHMASPEKKRYNFDTGHFGYSQTDVPCTTVMKMPVVKAEHTENDIPTIETPIITSNSLRGGFRRCIADFINERFAKENNLISLDVYHLLKCLSISGSPEKNIDREEVMAAQKHPYMGIFGGGPRLLRSKLRVDTAFMVSPTTVAQGTVPKSENSPVPEQYATHVMMFRRVDDALEFNDDLAPKVIESYPEAIKSWMEFTSESKAKRKSAAEESGNKKAGGAAKIASWSCMEVVIPGVDFYFNFEIDSDYEAHAGILLLGMERLFQNQDIGGWTRNGFGHYSVHHTNMVYGDDKVQAFVMDDGVVKLNTASPLISSLMKKGQEGLLSITKEELAAFSQSKA